MRLVLLGPPGAGKGTIAHLIREKFGTLHISTGDILRDEMQSASTLGKKVKSFVDSGELVPDQIVIQIIENKLNQHKKSTAGYLLDGFPRTVEQAKELDKILSKIAQPLDYALYMESSEAVIIMRLTGRRVCQKCGAIFHIKNKPPRVARKCDECGGTVDQRPDDKEATIRKRLEVYLKKTAPIIAYYEAQDRLLRVDGDKDSQDVLNILMKSVHENRIPDQHKNGSRNRGSS